MADLEQLDPENDAGRISSKIGKRKKEIMLERAKELGIKILNKGL